MAEFNASRAFLAQQLRFCPVRNVRAQERDGEDGGRELSIPLVHTGWSRALQTILPIANERALALDRLGTEFLDHCDGEHNVEWFIDLYMERWQLSFFESRALVLQVLQVLMKHNVLVLVGPDSADDDA